MTTAQISIITSLLSLIGVIVVALINGRNTSKQIESQNNLQLYRLEQLEAKVAKHNNLVERMAIAEHDIEQIKREIEEFDDGK